MVTLGAVLERAVETSRPVISRGEHRLEVRLPAAPVFVSADPVRLAQVFSNLLNNSAKYTERGGSITISAEPRGDEVVVSVADTGIGIPADLLPRLFDMYAQADTALERSQGGLGIGLALVHGLVRLHGGSIEARSDGPGRGTEMVVRLPVGTATSTGEVPPAARGTVPRTPRPLRILVADDVKDSADSLAMLLRTLGHDVRIAYDGSHAIQLAASSRFDAVVLDLGMPKVSGYEVCRRIREQVGGDAILVVAVSGRAQEQDRERSSEAGFDHHLAKPVDFRELAAILAMWCAPRDRPHGEGPRI